MRNSFNSDKYCFIGLGVGMLIGFRPGFLARPYGYSHSHSYQKEHRGQNYNKREDGLIECATSNTVNYIKVSERIEILKTIKLRQFFFHLFQNYRKFLIVKMLNLLKILKFAIQVKIYVMEH